MNWIWLMVLLLLMTSLCNSEENFRPCSEISRELRFPCTCSLGPIETILDNNPSISVNCDRIVFAGDVPTLPYGAPIVAFRQRWAGHQSLPTQIFSSNGLPLRSIDLSGNSLRRLTERLLQGLQSTLTELRLADNLLGDTLNPIFSTNEFHGLNHLQILDLSGNSIKAIEEGILEGCHNLQEFHLDRNSFTTIPSLSLNGPKSLKILSLNHNRIGIVKTAAFQSQSDLQQIDLSHNLISIIEGGALIGLKNLLSLKLNYNRLTKFNSDVFQNGETLQILDLSENFITEFPSVALKNVNDLKYLNLSSNLIQNLDNNDLSALVKLQNLDLSRNNIASIVPGTFLGLRQLRKLDISVNSLRTVEDDAFEGLDNLEELNLKDNNILLIPASALGRLPQLTTLQLDYNRIAALSGDIFSSIAERVRKLTLSKNVVRELPSGTFQYFQQLEEMELTRNLLTILNTDSFIGLEDSLKILNLAQNRIATITINALSLPKLERLDLSDNHLSDLTKHTFSMLTNLKYLNLSHNQHLTAIPSNLIQQLDNLEVFDFSSIDLKVITPDFFSKSRNLKEIHLKYNSISELSEGIFVNLPNLTIIDLSYNRINNIKQGTFVNVMNLKQLNLQGNQLNSFKGEFFNTGTSLEILDISNNQLSYLFPSSFRIHPRLKQIHANNNRFTFFPAELIGNLQFLELINLSNNSLKTIEEMDFARLPRLRQLLISHNQIEIVDEMAFHNSTQLQIIDLSFNKLDRLNERTFDGLLRLELLDLEGNQLNDLPETVFERARLQMLENINLARNSFELAPLKSLQRQYFFISKVDLSYNKIREIPADDSIMVNIKNLDLSFNPLTQETVLNILGEPKTVRELNLAGTGIKEFKQLETPFLNYLNLSFNNIENLNENIFERTTLLEVLDVSHNKIIDSSSFQKIWNYLKNLQSLNLSSNPIDMITQNTFNGLDTLKSLSLHSLNNCERIEKTAFKSIPNLAYLDIYNYPKLGYLDIQGLLQNLPSLEYVNIETKDAAIGSDQLQSILHPRLKLLGLYGIRLKSISSGTLSGIKGGNVVIKLMNTSLTSLPPALFFPVPKSSKVLLDVSGSQLTTLSPQILVTIDDRRGDLRIIGLETNPIVCDCNARALRRWLPSHMTTIQCTNPPYLIGRLLVEIGDDELSCDPRKFTTPQQSTTTILTTHKPSPSTRLLPKITEPDIIWSIPVAEKPKTKSPSTGQSLYNDDTLIIGIVGGVVAFIAALIIIICIIRLRMNNHHEQQMMATNNGGMVGNTNSSCACSVKGVPTPTAIYAMPPQSQYGYSATLPHKIQQATVRPSNYSTMGRIPYYQNNAQPYFIAYSTTDTEKIYR